MFRLISLLGVVVVNVLCAIAAYHLDHGAIMEETDQLAVVGGEWKTGLCIAGSGECAPPDTLCSQGDDYCMEQKSVVLCSDALVKNDPTRCTSETYTTLECDNVDLTVYPEESILCYLVYYCHCQWDGVSWACEKVNQEPVESKYVGNCQIKS